MLLLFVALAVFVAWSWLSYPAVGHWLYDLSTALEARLYKLHKIEVPIAEMTVSTWQGGPYEAASAILMLHGYSAEKNLWLRFAKHFVRQYRVIIPDIAGHGETGFKAGGGYDIALQAKRMIQLLDVCGVEKVHVIGNSMGGYIAAWLAATYPERIASVALIDPAFVPVPEPNEVADVFEVPLAFLMDPAHHRRQGLDWEGRRHEWFAMPYQQDGAERYIWGATAGMLRNLYHFLAA